MQRAITTRRFRKSGPRYRDHRGAHQNAQEDEIDAGLDAWFDLEFDRYLADAEGQWWLMAPFGEGEQYGPRLGADPWFPRMVCPQCERMVPSTDEPNLLARKPLRHLCDPNAPGRFPLQTGWWR